MDENGFKKVAAGLTLSGGLLIASAASLTFVPVGSVGVRTTLGKVTGETCDEGLRLKFPPFVAGIHKMDAKIQKLELDLEGSTKDLQTVQTGLALNFRLDKSKAPEVYRAFGDEYAERVIRPNMSEVYKAICARYNAEELITKRETVSGEVLESAQNILGRARRTGRAGRGRSRRERLYVRRFYAGTTRSAQRREGGQRRPRRARQGRRKRRKRRSGRQRREGRPRRKRGRRARRRDGAARAAGPRRSGRKRRR